MGRNGKRLCQGGKPGTGKLNTDVYMFMWLCGAWLMALGLWRRMEVSLFQGSGLEWFYCNRHPSRIE